MLAFPSKKSLEIGSCKLFIISSKLMKGLKLPSNSLSLICPHCLEMFILAKTVGRSKDNSISEHIVQGGETSLKLEVIPESLDF